MSQQKRKERQRLASKKNHLLILLAVFIFIFIFTSLWRSKQNLILETEQYTVSEQTTLYFFKDMEFMQLDGFSQNELAVEAGTKVSSYQTLTNSELMISSSYVNNQINVINSLLSGHYYDDWSKLRDDMINTYGTLTTGSEERKNQKAFLLNAARYCGYTQKELEAALKNLQNIKTDTYQTITLDNMGDMMAGYVFPYVTEAEKASVEEMLCVLTPELLTKIESVGSDQTAGIKVVSNDHMYAVCSLDADTYVQGEDEALELKASNMEDMTDKEYYDFLVQRVDLLRQYPELSFTYNKKTYDCYLVNVIEQDGQKLLVLMMKDGIADFLDVNKQTVSLNTVNFQAWVVPRSAITHQDGHTYVTVVDRDYFEELTEVTVSNYNGTKAALKYSENSELLGTGNLKDGKSIRIYP